MTLLLVVAMGGVVSSVMRLWRSSFRRWRRVIGGVSWCVLALSAAPPVTRWSASSLPWHMSAHIVVMFLAPMGVLAAGAHRDWWWLLPVSLRRRLLRWWFLHRRHRRERSLWWLWTLLLNVVMVVTHLPRVFSFAMTHPLLMDDLLQPFSFVAGALYFTSLVPSGARRVRGKLRFQLASVVITMVTMLVLAMAMSIFSTHSWYVMPMDGMPGMSMPVSFHDQQLAAAILWICGDLWAVPLLVVIVRRLIVRDGSVLGALDRYSPSTGR